MARYARGEVAEKRNYRGTREVDVRLERMEEGRGMNMIVRLIETFYEAAPISIVSVTRCLDAKSRMTIAAPSYGY